MGKNPVLHSKREFSSFPYMGKFQFYTVNVKFPVLHLYFNSFEKKAASQKAK